MCGWMDGLTVGSDVEQAEQLSVWPNPSEGLFHVRMDGFAGREVRMEAYDAMGRKVWETPASVVGNAGYLEEVVDLSGLSQGRYFLRIWDGLQMRTKALQLH